MAGFTTRVTTIINHVTQVLNPQYKKNARLAHYIITNQLYITGVQSISDKHDGAVDKFSSNNKSVLRTKSAFLMLKLDPYSSSVSSLSGQQTKNSDNSTPDV